MPCRSALVRSVSPLFEIFGKRLGRTERHDNGSLGFLQVLVARERERRLSILWRSTMRKQLKGVGRTRTPLWVQISRAAPTKIPSCAVNGIFSPETPKCIGAFHNMGDPHFRLRYVSVSCSFTWKLEEELWTIPSPRLNLPTIPLCT